MIRRMHGQGFIVAELALSTAVMALWEWPRLQAAAGIAFLAVLATDWLLLRRPDRLRQRRSLAGKCPACGYDLRGNVSGTCPECGTAAGTAADTAKGSVT